MQETSELLQATAARTATTTRRDAQIALRKSTSITGFLFALSGSFFVLLSFIPTWLGALNQVLIPQAPSMPSIDVRIYAVVAGSLLVGFAVAMINAARASSSSDGVNALAVGLLAWFVIDTLGSLAHGSWQNAALNTLFLLAGVIPLTRLSAVLETPNISRGLPFPISTMQDVEGGSIPLSGAPGLVHIQFRRFSGCPLCNIHLPSFARHMDSLDAANVREVVVFHSEAELVKENNASAPWARKMRFVADPERRLYKIVGADFSGWKYLFRLRLLTVATGMSGLAGMLRMKRWGLESGTTQRPMDVLLDAATGEVVDFKYGTDPYDQWSAAEVLAIARDYTGTQSATPS